MYNFDVVHESQMNDKVRSERIVVDPDLRDACIKFARTLYQAQVGVLYINILAHYN